MVIVLSESMWRRKNLRRERARKLIHIAVGVFAAFWPFFLPLYIIQTFSLAMLVTVLLSRQFNIFGGIHSVRRQTYGDVLYPIAIGLVATFAASPWIAAAALLHLGLADGMAAVVGDRSAKKSRYKVNGQIKSIPGSLTFLIFSFLILAGLLQFMPAGIKDFDLALALLLSLAATATENLSSKGTDNLFVPLLIVTVLNQFI